MARISKKKGERLLRGEKATKSALVSVRFDPRLRYLAELAARKQRRTLSSLVEWAVGEAVKGVRLGDDLRDPTLEQEARSLWASDEPERFVRLALSHPELLSYDEDRRWRLLRASYLFAPAERRDSEGNSSWDWAKLEEQVFPVLQNEWGNFIRAASGFLSEQREWVERTRLRVARGEIYPDIETCDTYQEIRASTKLPSKQAAMKKSAKKR